MRGRPKKSDAQKILDGNPGHTPIGGEVKVDGSPIKPKRLTKDAAWLWDLVVQKWMGEIDTPALMVLCDTWLMLKAATAAAKKNPLDKDCRIAFCHYKQEFDRLGARFGMTPSDRARIRLPVDGSKGEDEDKFFGMVG